MRYRFLLMMVCLVPLRGPTLAQQPAATDKYGTEWKTLQQEYAAAERAYYDPLYKAKTDAERQKVQLDPKKEPSKLYLAKFQALAKRADGTETGARATAMITSLAPQTGNKAAAREAYHTLFTKYAGTPEAERAVAGLRYAGYSIGEDETRKILRSIIDGASNEKMKAAALFTLGANMLDDRSGTDAQKQEARKLFDKLKTNYSSSAYAKQADGALFELDNLQIGKAAPDFEAKDIDDKAFRLSDYRGKVVVIDFWGFW